MYLSLASLLLLVQIGIALPGSIVVRGSSKDQRQTQMVTTSHVDKDASGPWMVPKSTGLPQVHSLSS